MTLVVAGALGALACSDDAPANADAAACTCAPAEPPLAGRLVRVENRRTSAAGFLSGLAICADGATLLGGGCYTEGVGSQDPRLISAGGPVVDTVAFLCQWDNPQMNPVTTVAWAMCLTPAP